MRLDCCCHGGDLERALKILKAGRHGILVRNHNLIRRRSPVYSQVWIIKSNRAIGLWIVVTVDFVGDLGLWTQGYETVQKPFRDQ